MFRFARLAAAAVFFTAAAAAHAQQPGDRFRADDFEYGPRNDLAPGQSAEIWNPAKRKLMEGGPLIGGTVRGTDPRIYCAMAGGGYDFVWVEMQHEAISWEQVSRMWRTCPGEAVPGVRVAYADEREIQQATDMGGVVIIVPTIDSVEEAQAAIDWTYFPPLGRRSSGGGQGPGELWNRVPGGYRQTWNANVVLVLMIETLEGVENAREIAKLPGVTALFAASGDLGNFSGYREGDPQYDALIEEVAAAAREAGIHLCGPLRWADRPGVTCFQAATEGANIRRGAQAEIQQALERFSASGAGAGGGGVDALVGELNAQCAPIVYEADCLATVRRAATAGAALPAAQQAIVLEALRRIVAGNPSQAAQIREAAAAAGLSL
ncbi:MAG TPA: aldolase/citrate lyase family protein [Longimicrobiaceae bacterium]|nr:aldolase/citrate lyase family protein [Longimicrobiaceae bacterium]